MKIYCKEFPIRKMAKVFKISRAGYYRYINIKPSLIEEKNDELVGKIKSIFKNSRNTYGSQRIHAMLKRQVEACSRKKVAKLMKKNNIFAKTKKKWKPRSKTGCRAKNVAPNLLNQNFSVLEMNRLWVLDMTYINTNEGWLYLSTVLDLFSRKIVGLSWGVVSIQN